MEVPEEANPLFDYLIVIDFESTCWNDGKRHLSQEIIEFPAVLLNTSTGEIESEFHAYVQPQEHPILSEFCMELTGIKQAQVNEGFPLKICLSQFCKWIHKIQQQKKIIFATDVSDLSTSEVKLCAFVTWSDWDLGVCLEYECKRKQLLKPVFLNSWIDLRVTYKIFYKRKPKGLSGALKEVGIEFSGREHSGLDDSRNTALLAWKMIRDGCVMKITRCWNKVPPKKNSNILARNLTTNQVEETSACKSNISDPSTYVRESKDTVSSHEKVQMKSVDVNSPIKVQQDELRLKSNIKTSIHDVNNSLSLLNTKSSTSLRQFQTSSLNSPIHMQKQTKNEHLILNNKSKSSTTGSELVLVSTTISSVNHVSDMKMSSTLDCLPLLADWEDVALLPASQPEQNVDYIPPISDSNLGPSFNSGERTMGSKESKMSNHGNFGGTEKIQKSETTKSIVFKSPHTTIYNVKEAKDQGSDDSDFKLPECKSSTFNGVHATMSHSSVLGKHPPLFSGTKRYSSSSLVFPPAKKQTFTVHEEKPTSSHSSHGSGSSRKVLPAVLTSAVNLQEPWRSGKMTPPLCKCGRRSKRLVVSNNGPNHGKVFYCCPIGKHQENKKCCGYFKWEHTLKKEKASNLILSHSSGGLTVTSPEASYLCDRNVSFPTKNSLRLRPSMRN
ncbi:PREDICTED: ERI1 exoribonuclease 2 isoform X2 [Condylura cristata]|uniref:ERI1 exoribonuclease 2 isoform X2 n=1 Tax=Condylura cristata TaxID=143302 RepID=UPI000643AB89|nr:PREDICTED: ERI1 exoribonuclease 2 isoform X2 [Condylura cristata]